MSSRPRRSLPCYDASPARAVSMLMSNADRPARLHYMANGFRVLSPGDHVTCAVSGARIRLEELRYWSVSRQAPYATAQIASEAMAPR